MVSQCHTAAVDTQNKSMAMLVDIRYKLEVLLMLNMVSNFVAIHAFDRKK